MESCTLNWKSCGMNVQLFIKVIKFKTIRPWVCSCLLQPVIWSDGSSLWRRCRPLTGSVLPCSRARCHTQDSLMTGTGSIRTQAGSRDSCTGLPPGCTGHRLGQRVLLRQRDRKREHGLFLCSICMAAGEQIWFAGICHRVSFPKLNQRKGASIGQGPTNLKDSELVAAFFPVWSPFSWWSGILDPYYDLRG
jgi:hypothetical protein